MKHLLSCRGIAAQCIVDVLFAASKDALLAVLTFHSAVKRNIAAPTRNQALSALLFLYREVLDRPIEWVDDIERA